MEINEDLKCWTQNIVSKGLGMPEECMESVWNPNSSEELSASAMVNFFGEKANIGSILYFYYTHSYEEVEIETEEVVQKEKQPVEDGSEEVASPNDNEEEDENQMETTTVKVKSTVTESRLKCHARLNNIPSDTGDLSFVFLVRLKQGSMLSAAFPKTKFGSYVDAGCAAGELLLNLEHILRNVYLPLMDPDYFSGLGNNQRRLKSDMDDQGTTTASVKALDSIRNEFRGNLQKFTSQVSQTMQQVQGDVHLQLPDVVVETPESVIDDYDTVNQIEQALEGWSKCLSNVVNQETLKQLRGAGPLAEIEFWRERNATLSTIFEQVNMHKVQQMLKVMELVEANMISTFKYHFSELTKLYIEAKDNVKFLTTLERHFKNLATGSFGTIADTLPSMLNAIRMVWIISRHYNTDERMVPLMELIASEICTKVSKEINIKEILRKSPHVALQTIDEAKTVLELWHSTYMSVRERIEASGTDHRWEFDRKRLFEQSNYMAKICENLQEVATVLDQFHKFLGPELKAVTGDSQGIDEVMGRVDGLCGPLEGVPFDIFDRRYKNSWDAVMVQFRERVVEIESMTRKFIDTSFQKLRSAEGAFDLLQNFQNIQSRESINKQMMEKYKDILMQYTKELELLSEIFHSNKDDPPLYRHYPPVAGAIGWAQSLYHRAKKPIMRFRTTSDLLKSTYGEEVKERYLVFARAVDKYVKDLHHAWTEQVPAIANEHLKQPILGPKMIEIGKTDNGMPKYRMPNPPYFPNFSTELSMLIKEAKYLDRLGFEIPKEALNVTLQEDKYHRHVQNLTTMLEQYDTLMSKLSPVECHLLATQSESLLKVIRTGFSPLNWNSQRISSYIETCNKSLNEFGVIVSQIHKNSSMIEDVVTSIKNTMLVKESDFDTEVLEVSTFYERLERNRLARIDGLVEKYKSISPLLIKVEEIVAGVNTGASPRLSTYYLFWERRIYNAIAQMILSSMTTFQALLNITTPDVVLDVKMKRPPLCQIKATLNAKDIILTPSLPDVYKYVSKGIKNIIESSKCFTRWMHGTCKEAESQVVAEDEDPVIFTFYSDIASSPHIIKMMLSLNEAIHNVFKVVSRYMEGWKRYETVYGLWNKKRRLALEKLVDRSPSCVYFDARLGSYLRLAESIRNQPSEKDIEFLRVDCFPVAIGIANQADAWKLDYGRILHETSSKLLAAILHTVNELEKDLQQDPSDLESLKFVLNTIANIESQSMEMELNYLDIIERYRTLNFYGITIDADEFSSVNNLEERWKTLSLNSKTKDLTLAKIKKKFREVTKTESIEFKAACLETKTAFYQSGPGSNSISLEDGAVELEKYREKIAEFQTEKQKIANAEALFALPVTSFAELVDIQVAIDKLSLIYNLYQEQKSFVREMSGMLWSELDIQAIVAGVEKLELQCRKFPRDLRALSTFVEVEQSIMRFKDSLPLIQSLKNDCIKPRHWDELMDLTGVKFEMNPQKFTLQNLFSMNLSNFSDGTNEIVNSAMQEHKIDVELQNIEEIWKCTAFEFVKYMKDGVERGLVLRSADEIKLVLEDHMLNLQTMSGSRFISSFSDRVRGWERKLNAVNDCIDVWFVVQRKWIYLESIFVGAEDIRLQLPEEAKKFDGIDKVWKGVMNTTKTNPIAVEACTVDNRHETLKDLSERLDRCQKSLSDYLDTKRNSFPRFFFISDDELLSVLGSSDPTSIQVHMLKLYDNVKLLRFSRNNKQVIMMESSETESFTFRTPAAVDGPVEKWMAGIEKEMRSTLLIIAKEGVFNYANMDRCEWLREVLGMIGLVGSQIWWTWEVEDVFHRVAKGNKYALKDLEVKLTNQLNELVRIIRTPLDNLSRKKVNTLLIIDVHARDIVDSFVRDSILNEKEFAWESQLRFYWDRTADDIVIRQCTGKFTYGYEYMGLNGRLVITPLTDRCYMTLTQALTFKLGGSPAGPAGTGKTETVKDLAKSLALPCYVINCGEGLDYKAMGSIFSGLVQVGAWGCFDEFNRINIEVLSVVSAQLRAIQNALNYDKPTVDIGFGTEIQICRTAGFATCGFFITMNPGYAGRTELPDNLKALFRPVTMIVPDLLQICQIMLFSEGFENAVVLAKKMTVLYQLSKEQLSKQFHYDFGLRALKSVLVMAGSLKREYSTMNEDLVLMRALRDSNMPKFIFEDVPLFHGLINDLFPNLDCPRVGYADLKASIESELESGDYDTADAAISKEQVDKIIQMYETMLVRHTTMIVGPTGGGKSLVLDTLAAASMSALGLSVKIYIINPKAQSVSELYGTMDPVTRDWTDGVLSKMFRELNQPLPNGRENERRWLIFDGDVDAVWVENMNSVMDDNRLLTLPNGERIRLQGHCSMVCETFDLQYASPATISRCGMVWVDPKNLGYTVFFERWLKQRCRNTLRSEEKTMLNEFFNLYVPRCVEYVTENTINGEPVDKVFQIIPVSAMELCKQLCNALDAFLSDEVIGNCDRLDIEGAFIYSIVWSIGAALVDESRSKFDNFLKDMVDCALPNEIVYDFFYDLESHRWASWDSKVSQYVEPMPFNFSKILVPTRSSVLYTSLLSKTAMTAKPVMFIGESGTSKTVTIQNYLSSIDPQTTNCLTMNFSSRTGSLDVQNIIQANVDKRSGKFYGPPAGKKLIVFIDDLNMPKVDLYGTQQPIALLHFLVGRSCFYDRGKDLDLRILKDMLYIAAMGPPGGGRNKVDPRFTALFNIYSLSPPNDDVLKQIYGSVLDTYLSRFDDSVRSCSTKLTTALLRIYCVILEKLPPTPSKFHYIFNLRDLGRVCEGVCMATPEKLSNPAGLLRLFCNEINRIFCDRLTCAQDADIVEHELGLVLQENFSDQVEQATAKPLLFGNFLGAAVRLTGQGEDAKLYQNIESYQTLRSLFDEILECYNLDHKPMRLVLFEMALEHMTRILRIITNPLGNALLVGVGGSGKQSLSRLAAFTAGYKTYEIALSRGYGEAEFRENLKDLYRLLGQGPVVFLFTDAHVVEEGFLEFINNLLTTGIVPALFEQEEMDALGNTVRQEVKAAGLIETNENCWKYYISRCQQNMHIILAMSPSGDTLRVRCRNFPGLVSATIIDWFFAWPEDALRNVASYFLAEETLPNEFRPAIENHLVHAHTAVISYAYQFELELRRHYYVTPKNYLDFISNYRYQLKDNNLKVLAKIKRLEGGLTKLNEASTAVDKMQIELSDKKIVVDEKTINCQALIQTIEEKSTVATAQQEIASVKQEECEIASTQITKEKLQADEALMEALPAIEAAAEALQDLSKSDLTEIKAFASPPTLVKAVCMCVLHLKPTGQDLEDEWKGAKIMLGNPNLLGLLQNYAKDDITPKMISKVKAIFKNPDLNIDNMRTVSKAGAGLLVWVIAIMKYYEVAKNVEPLRQKVKKMEKEQAFQQKELASLTSQLSSLKVELDSLSSQFAEANTELQDLKAQADQMQRRLSAASKLLDGLGSEKKRWTEDVSNLKMQGERLVGDCLLAASFLSYSGAFSFDYRFKTIYTDFFNHIQAQELPLTESFKLESLLTDDATIQKWVAEGLPADEHSIQNGILTTNSSRFPLCIDPQQQAVSWIKRREADNNLTVKTLNDSDFLKHLELAIQFGNPFLFEAVDEELDPILDPILEKNTYTEGSRLLIVLGDKSVEWDKNFRLYFTSKLANPHYSPEVMGKTMIVNYSVTQSGLSNQLLNVVVAHERPDLEQQYSDLVQEMSEGTRLIVELENTLLRELSSSSGNILDNEELIQTLDETKNKATEIGAKLEQSSFTRIEISKARAAYSSVALRGSVLYFSMSALSTILKMYEISLTSFLNVFNSALDAAKPDPVLDSRLGHMQTAITELLYDYTCVGIFEKHKLMFSFQMTCMILDASKELVRSELDFFLKGNTSLEAAAIPRPQILSWISESGWKDVLYLNDHYEVFSSLSADLQDKNVEWKAWYDLEAPEITPFPQNYSSKCSKFQMLLLCRCFRQDRVYNAIKLFVIHHMGEKFVQPPVLDYGRIFQQSTPFAPIVCILSPGADPQSDIQLLGEETGFTGHKFKFLALGQGQGPLAEQMLEAGHLRGHWVLLQNCHLLASWLRTLEKILLSIQKPHKNFRLWLTTEPTEKFPLGILQRSLKVVTEPPDGLKQNMRSLYSKLDQSALDECPNPVYRPIVYVLCFLHAVVLERRKYGKIGWNVPYDFNESDFNISKRLLNLYLCKAYEDNDENMPWGSLKYLIADAMYGGRVSDYFDRRVLSTYLSEYVGDFLFDDCQPFYFSQSGFDYALPEDGPIENYVKTVESLPLTNSPAVFGLHPNAEIGYYTNMTKSVWVDLISLQPRSAGTGEGMSREQYISAIASDIQSKIPPPFDLTQIRKKFGLSPSPTQVVLMQELDRWSALTTKMSSSLADLQKALLGEIGMSDELDAVGDALFNGFLPSLWRRLCPATEKPLGSWMLHFTDRYTQYHAWVENDQLCVIWLSGLGIPESYLTALVQTTCRAKNWPLDKSTLYTKVTKFKDASEIATQLESGCYVRGLYLEGASWNYDQSCLQRQEPKKLVEELPILQVIPIETSRLKLFNTFRTPVYVTQQRRNAMGVGLVFEADLDTTEHPSHWVLQGVALSLNIDS